MRIESIEALAAHRENARASIEAYSCRILVCSGNGCMASGAQKVYDEFSRLLEGTEQKVENLTGMEVDELCSQYISKNIPVIFLTGIADRDKIQQALALNPQGYILKPTDKKTLREKISAVLG